MCRLRSATLRARGSGHIAAPGESTLQVRPDSLTKPFLHRRVPRVRPSNPPYLPRNFSTPYRLNDAPQ
jgi:hypothetical protein